MHALSEYIGVERVNDALRRLFEKHGSRTPPLPTSLDLYRELQAVTPDQFRSLLHDLFEVNAYWELETERATADETAAGAWQVTLDVRARKVVVDEAGVETEVPMDDWVQVGVFAPADKGEESDNPLYRQMQRIRSGKQIITVTVPRKPTRAGIDPNQLLIDLKTDDNITTVRAKS
jgi:ABC-2 type transport system permease protein